MLKQVPTLPKVQYNEKEVEVPVMVRRQIPLVQRIQKMVEVPHAVICWAAIFCTPLIDVRQIAASVKVQELCDELLEEL